MYYMNFWLQLHDSNILVIEELPEEVGFESTSDDKKTISMKSTGSRKKRKSTADISERHLKDKQERKSSDDILKTQKAVWVQLKSYCIGMKELISLQKFKKQYGDDDEELQLIERMTATVGAAVSKMEPHIQAGSIWCPTAEENIDKTPKQKKSTRRCSSTSTISSTQKTIFFIVPKNKCQ
jgi:hypothetical protein